ncbi:MAG TPA: S41 family peptidase [Flavisolibacter sp.]|jgi:C-terminal processing protease CtpA/Prc|nr:S41 family peptidase [Flavisolibacter sp.]
MQFQRIFIPALLLVFTLAACKKEIEPQQNNPTPTPTDNTSAADKLKDSTLIYSKDIYLWNEKIPASFNARSYADPAAIMTAIRQYAIEPGFTSSVDRWSFAIGQKEWDNVSGGVAGDFGLNVFFMQEGDLRVRAVEKRSPAGVAGVKRGWRITKVNGSTDITTTNANFIVQQIYQSTSTPITFQKPDGSLVNLTLNAATYQESPVVMDSVYSVSNKKIGYFVFNSFLGDTTAVISDFGRVFNRFSAEGVQDVIIDLRYNGGGYVSLAENLANYLAPASANGDIMMTQKFNNSYARYNSTERFSKKGSLNLNRVFFIVGSGTASASELLINSLKPYMEVILLGASKTHGKPVGYFPIPIGTEWYILPVSFFTVNKNGEGHYFNGMALNSQVSDGLDKDWGDRGETSLASAINYITTGTFRTSVPGRTSPQLSETVISANKTLDAPNFKGAVDTRGMH